MRTSPILSGLSLSGLWVITFLLFAAPGHPALAGTGDALHDPQADALYQQLLAHPDDQDKTLAYARRAADLGDYEAAISPLERLLIVNPKSARLRLELGILYYMLGSNEVAKDYLTKAKDGASGHPEIASQADAYLSRM